MADRQILFSAPMVRALLAGTKTQTRRALRDGTWWTPEHGVIRMAPAGRATTGYAEVPCPYGQPGDRLWVREAWRVGAKHDKIPPRDLVPRAMTVEYEAGGYACNSITGGWEFRHEGTGRERPDWVGKLRPGMFMPRWASRITLEITGVRVERLQDISEADARAEGASYHDGRGIGHSGWRHDYGDVHADARSAYARLWTEINGPGSWDANPFVWVLEFRRAASAQGEKE